MAGSPTGKTAELLSLMCIDWLPERAIRRGQLQSERNASMPETRRYFAVLAASLLLAGFGCAGKDQPVKLEGMVTLDGEPVAGAIVSFLPDERGGRFAHGMTAKDG